MEDLDINDAVDLANKLEYKGTRVEAVSIEDQAAQSLWRFMSSVFQKVEDDYTFKKELQDELRMRMSEMDIQTMIMLYNRLNEHEVDAQRTAMYPFVPKEGKGAAAGGSSTIMDTLKDSKEASPEERLHEEASSEVLQGLQQLNALLGVMKPEDS